MIGIATAGLVVLGALTLFLTIGEMRAEACRDNRGASYVLALVITLASVSTQTTFLNGNNVALQASALFLIGAVCVVLLAVDPTGTTARARQSLPIWLALVLWFWLFVIDLSKNGSLDSFYVLSRLVAGLLWIPLVAATNRHPVSLRHFTYAILVALSMSVIVAPLAPRPWLACQSNKCGFVGQLFAGSFPQENFVGIQSNFAIFLTAAFMRGKVRVAGLALGGSMLVLSVSRSSLSIVGIGIGTVVLIALWRRLTSLVVTPAVFPAMSSVARWVVATVLVVPIVTIGLVLVHTSDPQAFTGRGLIWIEGRSAIGNQTLTGLGTDRWSVLLDAGLVPDHFPHSEYLLMLFSGGYVAVFLWASWLGACVNKCLRDGGRVQDLGIHFAILATGLTEIVWNPLTFDGLVWAALAVTITTHTAEERKWTLETSPPRRRELADAAVR